MPLEFIKDLISDLCFNGLVPLLFLNAKLLKSHKARIPSIADDMPLVGLHLDVATAFVELRAGLRELGLGVAPRKCKAICAKSIHPKTMDRLKAGRLSDEHNSFPSNEFVHCGMPFSVDFEIDEIWPVPYERDGYCEIISRNDEGNTRIMRLADGQA